MFTQEQVIQLIATAEAVRETIIKEQEGKIKPLNKAEAREAFGYENVNNWESTGLLKPVVKRHNLKLFRVSDLERLSRSAELSRRITRGY